MLKKLGYIILFLVASFPGVKAQNSQVLYFMNLPQNHLLNPALRPSGSLNIGLPVLTGISLNISNNFISNFSDIFMHSETGDSVITFLHPEYDIDDFLSKIKEKNSVETETGIQLFSLGFNAGENYYLTLDIVERFQENLVLPGELLRLMMKGNSGFAGKYIDLSSLRGDMKYFREFGLGFSGNLNSRLRTGIRGKLLFGIASASISNRFLGIKVDDEYNHTIDADLSVNFSGPVSIRKNDDNTIKSIDFDDDRFGSAADLADLLLSTQNLGLGVDIGAEYTLNDNIVLSAGVTDLGYIKWKKDISHLVADSSFKFSGFNLTDVINGTITFKELSDEMADSLKSSLKLSDSKNSFITYLPAGISIGGQYKLTKAFSAGVLSYSRIIGKQFKESLSISASYNLGNTFSTNLVYTSANHSYDNIGAGLVFRAGFFQLYLAADRIPVRWNKIISKGDKIPLPESWNTINLHAGMNLTFGNRVKSKNNQPGVVVE